MHKTQIKFFGTTGSIPDNNDDSPCFLINEKYLFDTGWSACTSLKRSGINPLDIEYLFFTHMHPDHYISLPTILFYYKHSGKKLNKLKIIGPKDNVNRIVDLSLNFLGVKEKWKFMPEIIELQAGDIYETDDMLFETHTSVHGVSGLCYKATDKINGKVIGITGDTADFDGIADFFDSSSALVYDVSLGLTDKSKESEKACGHSSVQEAIKTAVAVRADKIFFVHNSKTNAGEFLNYAKSNYIGEAVYPEIDIDYLI